MQKSILGLVIALLCCALAGVIAFVDSSGKTLAELHQNENLHPAVLTDWWVASRGDGAVLIAAVLIMHRTTLP